ncbi:MULTISPECIES: hypothetical protein [Cyanophyceae]|uniref:hypothetical protein n=1 Tax=Cyanophyceae TaxID=3028117 RepID=UPI001682E615|nr:hypothetical protein [Trichocoleus sp. FACHB-40]MBD2006742.1 hypothetical protein [Trichocoleus sp. FACHB-40]
MFYLAFNRYAIAAKLLGSDRYLHPLLGILPLSCTETYLAIFEAIKLELLRLLYSIPLR